MPEDAAPNKAGRHRGRVAGRIRIALGDERQGVTGCERDDAVGHEPPGFPRILENQGHPRRHLGGTGELARGPSCQNGGL